MILVSFGVKEVFPEAGPLERGQLEVGVGVGGERAEAQVLRVPGGQEAGAAVPDLRSRRLAPGMGRGAASLSYQPGRGRARL